MNEIGIGLRDIQLKAIIKSNLVCGDPSKIDEFTENLLKDICDFLDNYENPAQPISEEE